MSINYLQKNTIMNHKHFNFAAGAEQQMARQTTRHHVKLIRIPRLWTCNTFWHQNVFQHSGDTGPGHSHISDTGLGLRWIFLFPSLCHCYGFQQLNPPDLHFLITYLFLTFSYIRIVFFCMSCTVSEESMYNPFSIKSAQLHMMISHPHVDS